MNFLKKFRQSFSSNGADDVVWEYPQTAEQIDKFLPGSEKKICIYKHSNSCAMSLFAMRHVQHVMAEFKEKVDFCFIEVRKNREVSDFVVQKTGIRHESPQVLIISGGKVIWNASHGAIQAAAIREVLLQ